MNNRICVAVRKRPIADSSKDVVETPSPNVIVNEPKVKYDLTPYTDRHTFTFDEVFSERDNNADVYRRCCLPLIDTVFNDGNATCFAYGQTGSGKTHTMLGSPREPGLYAIAAEEIFRRAAPLGASIFVSFYEIYGRKIFDLLNDRTRLFAREDAEKVVNICGLSEHPVSDHTQIFDVIAAGSAYRAAGQTSANSESSRSHAVLQIEVREGAGAPSGRRGPKTIGRISFIDLAGNERGADTFDCDRKTRMEGAEINKSLLALKECIRALGMGKNHVPFRGSILTEVLRDSFTGNSRTTMISTISPATSHCVNTLNTLRYTQRVKDLGGPGGSPRRDRGEHVGSPQRRPTREAAGAQQQRKKRESPAPQARKRPEWISDFASPEMSGELDPNDDEAPRSAPAQPRQRQARAPSPRGGGGGGGAGGRPQVKITDPKIATIVQSHIAAIEDATDGDDEEEYTAPAPGQQAQSTLPPDEARQVRKVHAYVVEEIAKAEEKLVALHRRHIDSKMTCIKEEIRAIQQFEESDSVDEYVNKVREVLHRQREDIDQIMNMLTSISSMLKDEEDLSISLNYSARRAR